MSAASFKDIGNKALQAGNFDEAIKAYSDAIAIDPNDHVFYSNRSAAYLSKGDAENALADGMKCIEINPSWPKGYTRKGAALHALKRYDEAKNVYEQGLQIAPTDSGLKSGLAEVQKIIDSRSNPGMGGGLFGPQLLSKLVGHPKFGPKLADKAFMAKLQMLNTNPQLLMQDPELMEVLQVVLGGPSDEMQTDDYEAPPQPAPQPKKTAPPPEPEVPLSEEEKAVKAQKDRAVACKERGNALYKQKKFEEAIAAYEEAFAIDPTNIMYLNNKAAVLIEMGQCESAIELCKEALAVGEENRASFEDKAKVFQRVAGAYVKLNNIPAALDAYGKAQMEMYDKAIERKMKNLELELKKQEKMAYVNPQLGLEAKERGNQYFRDGNYPDAIKEYEEAVKRDPENAAYHNNLAAAYLKLGLFNDAKREAERSLELDRSYVKAWAKKGDIEFFMKEYHRAMDSYKAGLQYEPDNALCQQGLVKVQQAIASANYGGEVDQERARHAMADPEIQQILNDPTIRQVLTDLQENPKHGQQALQDPLIRSKIERLVASGILQIR